MSILLILSHTDGCLFEMCRLKLAALEQPIEQCGHWCFFGGVAECFFEKCVLKFDSVEKSCGHCGHGKRLFGTTACTCKMCLCRLLFSVNVSEHIVHWCFRFACSTSMCRVRLPGILNDFSHNEHWYSRSSEWVVLWILRSPVEYVEYEHDSWLHL